VSITPNGAAFDPDCDFCKIAQGEAESTEIICEGPSWLAFFPLDPATPGHTLVIPRAHVRDLWSLDTSLAGALMEAVVRVGKAIDSALTPQGMNLITSSGQAAEQTVFHLHLHVVPRWREDRIGRIWPPDRPMQEALREDIADRVREACERV
jgi:histidine triad (HIT) family protein